MTRLVVHENGDRLRLHKEKTESIIFENEAPNTPVEYALNKLLVPSFPNHMYLVFDWKNVILITDPNTANIYNLFAFPIP